MRACKLVSQCDALRALARWRHHAPYWSFTRFWACSVGYAAEFYALLVAPSAIGLSRPVHTSGIASADGDENSGMSSSVEVDVVAVEGCAWIEVKALPGTLSMRDWLQPNRSGCTSLKAQVREYSVLDFSGATRFRTQFNVRRTALTHCKLLLSLEDRSAADRAVLQDSEGGQQLRGLGAASRRSLFAPVDTSGRRRGARHAQPRLHPAPTARRDSKPRIRSASTR